SVAIRYVTQRDRLEVATHRAVELADLVLEAGEPTDHHRLGAAIADLDGKTARSRELRAAIIDATRHVDGKRGRGHRLDEAIIGILREHERLFENRARIITAILVEQHEAERDERDPLAAAVIEFAIARDRRRGEPFGLGELPGLVMHHREEAH